MRHTRQSSFPLICLSASKGNLAGQGGSPAPLFGVKEHLMHSPKTVLQDSLSRRDFLRAGTLATVSSSLTAATAAEVAGDNSPSQGYIDAHVHIWSADTVRYPLKRGFPKEKMRAPSFTPEELFVHTRPCGVTRIVLIQLSYYGYDNSYMLDMMRKHRGVFSGVAMIDKGARPRERMVELARRGVRGFRITPRGLPADRWLDGDAMAAMWRCGADKRLAMCPLIDPKHLPAVEKMCRRFPDTPVVIDHFARIGIDGQFRKTDLDNLCGLARHKNVHVKVSAFSALGKRKAPYLDLAPMIRRVLDAFGPERLMWATDSPWQVMDGHTYKDSLDLIRVRIDFLTDDDRQWILRKTAQRMFFS
jgi:predicted TIM-barrel fold metal-dependent hydrolase